MVRGRLACILYRIAHHAYRWHIPVLPLLLFHLNAVLNGCEIHYAAEIGPGLAIAHPHGVVIGRGVFTGWNVGQLMLTLLRAGFDIREGAYARSECNVFALVRGGERPPAFPPNDEIVYRCRHLFPSCIEEKIERRCFTNAFGETVNLKESAQEGSPMLPAVLVDDGSTNATPMVLADFARAEPRTRVIVSPCLDRAGHKKAELL